MVHTRRPARILLVDDETPFRESLAEMLRDDGHQVLECSEPAKVPPAAELGRIDLLLTDYEMPGKDGLVFADEFHAHDPGLGLIQHP